jgi:hypothetical protein
MAVTIGKFKPHCWLVQQNLKWKEKTNETKKKKEHEKKGGKKNQKTKHKKREDKRETSQTTLREHDLFQEQSGLLKHSPTQEYKEVLETFNFEEFIPGEEY